VTTKYPRPGEFTALQAKWRAAYDAKESLEQALRNKYGRFDRSWLGRGDRTRFEQAEQRASKAADKVFAWLDRWSPWDWGHGTSMYWILNNLTEAQALSPTPLLLPARSAGYGAYEVDRFVQRR
jgi:hypothetical protein